MDINTFRGKKRNTARNAYYEQYNINGRIRAQTVRLVGEGVEPDIYSREEALNIARKMRLDLVEISPNANPPVCKVIDYSKFKYEQKRREKLLKSKSQRILMKEIRFSPGTDAHDFEFKLRHAKKFLKDGAKLKANLKFSGREVKFKERGEVMLLKFAQALEEYGTVEQMPKLEGRRMILFMIPKKK